MSKNTTSTECLLPKGNFLFRKPLLQNMTGVAVSLMSVIVYLKWSSVCIVHDNETEYQATILHQMLSGAGIFGNIQRMEQMTSQRIDALMSEKTAAHDDTSLNCTLLCSLNACQNYLAKWNPFVVFVEKRNEYTGFTMDLLQHLALALNFTYEISRPPDGKWGAQTENGSWNGLIGQLERRVRINGEGGTICLIEVQDVDLVAAPVTVQITRENAVDFTLPYYYDSGAILLKKPDPIATKWRTLIDPLSGYVILCIFIFLPVTSLFLFFFEKCTPYYRKMEDRDTVRGLHHFSDSFWYMYGALLTQGNFTLNQGGEHMAGSSSGRTLLSSWWIFCIIMMATYTGNLVAFLTVTKEKLPFSDIAGLVEQDSYRWGTQEGTVFETIFKASTRPDYIKFWKGVVSYNKTKPSILSANGDVQVRLVMEGDYAYVGDKTHMELTMVNNCHLTMALSDIVSLQYAIPLPNKSPFTKIFSDEMTAIFGNRLFQMWKLKHWPKHGICDNIARKESTPITLIDIHSSFYVVAIGVFIASSFLICECFKWKYHNRRLMQDKANQAAHETELVKMKSNVEESM